MKDTVIILTAQEMQVICGGDMSSPSASLASAASSASTAINSISVGANASGPTINSSLAGLNAFGWAIIYTAVAIGEYVLVGNGKSSGGITVTSAKTG